MRLILAVLSDRVVADCERERIPPARGGAEQGMSLYSQQHSDHHLSGGRAAKRSNLASALPAERRLWRASALGD